MSRVGLEDFGDDEVSRIYLAAALSEAKRVEDVLTGIGIEYAVEVEPYVFLNVLSFFSEYKGAVFYVLAARADQARQALIEAGLTVGVQDEADE